MSQAKCDIRIGTSGWHYGHWAGPFYPVALPRDKWFAYYAKNFDAVEINNTFYQLPREETFKNWRKRAPAGFLFAVKANRYITHVKRLKDPQEPLDRFLGRVWLLGENLGPILYQLPPGLHKDLGRLESFIKLLPKQRPSVFEFRHESWYCEDTFELLRRFGVGFCIHDLSGLESPRAVTSDIIYIRFHGTTGRYSGCYSKSMLANWAKWLKDQAKNVRGIYVYFNNDQAAYAVRNAKELKEQFS